MITHLKPEILECEVKRALGSTTTNKVGGGYGTPAELESDESKSAAFNMPTDMENSAVATGLEKSSFHSNPRKRQYQRILKLKHNCTHLTC